MADARDTGSFRIGGDLPVHRLGYGAMRLTGGGIWGPPADRDEALRTLRRLPALGVQFIDTADSYGPDVSEQLIREALHPYDGLVIATKGGLARTGPDVWVPLGRPEYLIQQAHKSRVQLGVERIDLWQLHRIDAKVPRDERPGLVVVTTSDDRVLWVPGVASGLGALSCSGERVCLELRATRVDCRSPATVVGETWVFFG